ncbi:MAG: L,D-transpeptidase [Pseudomonadota bacterium]|nr:L,D-transpeptidase [Pseudomonadota bacterium]
MKNGSRRIEVSIPDQSLTLWQGTEVLRQYSVSTAANGPGEQADSYCTPRGAHYVRALIGRDAPPGAVFVGRRFTGEIYSPSLARANPGRDWILTRILWLCGREVGKNRLGRVDTFRRYIYIHGSPDELAMGEPGSKGCIRMRNGDVIELFDLAYPGIPLTIHAN